MATPLAKLPFETVYEVVHNAYLTAFSNPDNPMLQLKISEAAIKYASEHVPSYAKNPPRFKRKKAERLKEEAKELLRIYKANLEAIRSGKLSDRTKKSTPETPVAQDPEAYDALVYDGIDSMIQNDGSNPPFYVFCVLNHQSSGKPRLLAEHFTDEYESQRYIEKKKSEDIERIIALQFSGSEYTVTLDEKVEHS